MTGTKCLEKHIFPRSEVAEISCGAETTGGKIKEKGRKDGCNDEVLV